MTQIFHRFSIGLLCAVLLCAVGLHNSSAQKQKTPPAAAPAAPGQLFIVYEDRVKPEMVQEYLNFYQTEGLPALMKYGVKTRTAWASAYGDDRNVFGYVQPLENFAALKDDQLWSRIPNQEEANALRAKYLRCLLSQRRYIIRAQPELSYVKPASDFPLQRALLTRRNIAPFRGHEFESFLKTIDLPFWRERAQASHYVYKIALSGDSNEYFELVPFADYTALDRATAPPPAPPPAQMSREELRRRKMPPGVVLRTEIQILTYRPELSIAGGKLAVAAGQ